MLVLGRKAGEQIVIGRDIRVVVVNVNGKAVRLGIEAPSEVPVRRSEVIETAWRTGDAREPEGEEATEMAIQRRRMQEVVGDRIDGTETTGSALLPTVREIRAVAAEELAEFGGRESDCVEQGESLFLRALLPAVFEVTPRDVVQAGIALRTEREEVEVRHYIFRRVCSNGAIMPQQGGTRRIHRVGSAAPNEQVAAACSALRDAIRACSLPGKLSVTAKQMRQATRTEATRAWEWLRRLEAIPDIEAERVRREILARFERGRDRSLYGLINATTSRARDEENSRIRWRLEALGGAVIAAIVLRKPPGGTSYRVARKDAPEERVLVRSA